MKILIVAPTPYFSDRGAHVQIYEQANAIKNFGHDVLILTYGIGRDVGDIRTKRCWTPKYYRKISAGPSFTKVFLIPVLALYLIRLKCSFKPDVIHAHLHEGALIAKMTNKLKPTPTIFDYQGSLTEEVIQSNWGKLPKLFYKILNFIESRINSWFPMVTQSRKMQLEILESRISRCAFDVINVRDGVDTKRFRPMDPDESLLQSLKIEPHHKRLIFMGYFSQHQGLFVLLDAFKVVLSQFREVTLILIGYPVTTILTDYINQIGISENLRLIGRIDYFEVQKYLSLGQIAVAPKVSKTEGDGKIYNYMAMGLPVVTFDRDVSREILGDTGIYSVQQDSEFLAKALLATILDSSDFGIRARERAVKELSWELVGLELLNVYQKCLNGVN